MHETPPRASVPTADPQHIADAFLREQRERRHAYIDTAKSLEAELRATVVGVWGHLTAVGAREYAVYKRDAEDSYFVVLGKKADFASYDAPEQVRKHAKRIVVGPRESIGEYEIRSIDPEHTSNDLPMKTLAEFLA